MRIWCAQCKRVQEVIERRRGRRRALATLAGRVGVCAVCHYPVSAIGAAMRGEWGEQRSRRAGDLSLAS